MVRFWFADLSACTPQLNSALLLTRQRQGASAKPNVSDIARAVASIPFIHPIHCVVLCSVPLTDHVPVLQAPTSFSAVHMHMRYPTPEDDNDPGVLLFVPKRSKVSPPSHSARPAVLRCCGSAGCVRRFHVGGAGARRLTRIYVCVCLLSGCEAFVMTRPRLVLDPGEPGTSSATMSCVRPTVQPQQTRTSIHRFNSQQSIQSIRTA